MSVLVKHKDTKFLHSSIQHHELATQTCVLLYSLLQVKRRYIYGK